MSFSSPPHHAFGSRVVGSPSYQMLHNMRNGMNPTGMAGYAFVHSEINSDIAAEYGYTANHNAIDYVPQNEVAMANTSLPQQYGPLAALPGHANWDAFAQVEHQPQHGRIFAGGFASLQNTTNIQNGKRSAAGVGATPSKAARREGEDGGKGGEEEDDDDEEEANHSNSNGGQEELGGAAEELGGTAAAAAEEEEEEEDPEINDLFSALRMETDQDEGEEAAELESAKRRLNNAPLLVNIFEIQRASARRRETNSLMHLQFFVDNHFHNHMPKGNKHLNVKEFVCTNTSKKGMNYQWWDKLIANFIGYLGTHARAGCKSSRHLIAYETANNYASGVKAYYQNKFRYEPEIPIFKENTWRKCRFKLRKLFEERCRQNGTKLTNPHLASTESDRQGIAYASLFLNTFKAAEFWHLCNNGLHCAGRGSECSLQMPEHHTEQRLSQGGNEPFHVTTVYMFRQKVGSSQDLPIFPHRDSWEQDWYFSLIYLIVMTPSSYMEGDYVFPNFARQSLKTNNTSQNESKVASYWKECFAETFCSLRQVGMAVNELLTSHCQKKAFNQKCAEMPHSNPLAQVFRSGWELRNVHSLFDYIVGSAKLLQQAGRSAAGWSHHNQSGEPRGGVPPTMDSLRADPDYHKSEMFVRQLFKNDTKNKWNPTIRRLAAASLLRHYDSVLDAIARAPHDLLRCPDDHRFVATVQACLVACEVPEMVFNRWKQKVRDDFYAANATCLPISLLSNIRGTSNDYLAQIAVDPRSLIDCYNEVSSELANQVRQNRRMQETVTALHCCVELMHQQQTQLLNMVQNQGEVMKRMQEHMQYLAKQPDLPILQHDVVPDSPPAVRLSSAATNCADDARVVPKRAKGTVIALSITIEELKESATTLSLADHFVFFFEKDAMEGLQLNRESIKKMRTTFPEGSQEIKDASKKVDKLADKLLRTKTAVVLLLMFMEEFPDYPRPADQDLCDIWKMDLRQKAETAQQMLQQEIDPAFPVDTVLSVDNFYNNRGRYAQFKPWNWLERESQKFSLPANIPEEFRNFLRIKKEWMRQGSSENF